MRSDTISLTPGIACGLGGNSGGGLVVAALNAFSAAVRESIGRRDMAHL
jgi:NAD(P)H-hydrate repair Nnr-like enzyme with NAD(P)H-hydrate epimerase domain